MFAPMLTQRLKRPLEIQPRSAIWLSAHEHRVVPGIAHGITQVVPLRHRLECFQLRELRQRDHAVRIETPAIKGVAVLGPARRRKDAADAPRLEHTCDLQHRDPEIRDVLERLSGNDDVSRSAGHLAPHVRCAQNDVNVGTGGHVEADVRPERLGEYLTVAAVHVLTANIQDA